MILMNGCKIVNGDKMKKIKYIFLIFFILIFCNAIIGCSANNDTTSDFSIEIQENTPIWTYIEIQYDKDDWKKYSSFSVYIDDEKVGKVKLDESKSFDLYTTTGEHKIYIERNSLFSSKKSPEETFVVSLDHRYFAYKITEKSFINPSLEEIETDNTISEKRQRENADKSKETTTSITIEIGDNNIENNYREVINACNQEDTENNFTYREYYITDINNDDIPELIIHIGRNIKDVECIIYTYKDNKIYECGVSGGNLSIKDEDEEKLERVSRESQEILSKGDNCIYMSFCYAGYQHTSEIKLNDDLLLEVSDYYDSGSEKLSDYNIPGEILESADFLDNDLLVSVFTKTAKESQTVVATKSVTTKENTMTVPITTTKEKSDDKTYSITFEADELIKEAGLQLGGHVGVAVLSNLTCSNGNANIETETIYAYDSLVRVEVTGAKAGEVVLGGTITTYGLDMFEGETVSYPVDSGVFLISKTVSEISGDKPYVNGYVETYSLSGHDGSKIRLYLNGDFSAVSVQIYNQEYTSDTELYSKEDFGDYIEINFNPFAQPPSVVYVTPYSDSGVSGDIITCDIPSDASGTIQTGGMSYPVDNMKGQINCHGGTVAGFTTDYVVNGGAVGKVRNSLGDTWHVTAKNACDNYGVTWYELWDSDDGDYYGWVDSSYIDFY